MRQRLGSLRGRPMARRPGGDVRTTLSPRARNIGGWLVALLLVLGIAVVVRVLGGNGDGPPIGTTPSGSAIADDLPPIAFGTAIDPASGQVAESTRTDRFVTGETFAYSVAPGEGDVPAAVYVEVRRLGGAVEEIAQEPVDDQTLPDPTVIAFTVPTEDLLAVFGAGKYLMLIYAEPDGQPIAAGRFELVSAEGSPAASP